MCGGEPLRDLRRDVGRFARRQAVVAQLQQTLAQRLAFEQLRDRVRHGLAGIGGLGTEVEDREDVGMRERGDGLRFALEPLERGRITGERRRQYFDGDVAIELRIARPIDFAHPPCANRRKDLVRTQSCSGSETHQDGSRRAGELYPLARWPKAHMKGRKGMKDMKENTCLHVLILIMFFRASSRTVDRSRCSAS